MQEMKRFHRLMEVAIDLARGAGENVPVAALLVNPEGEIVESGINDSKLGPFGHAEHRVILSTWNRLGKTRLRELTLVCTLEPCLTCSGLIRETNLARVVYGARNKLGGAGGSVYDILRDKRLGPPAEVISDVGADSAQQLLDDFFCRIRRSP